MKQEKHKISASFEENENKWHNKKVGDRFNQPLLSGMGII